MALARASVCIHPGNRRVYGIGTVRATKVRIPPNYATGRVNGGTTDVSDTEANDNIGRTVLINCRENDRRIFEDQPYC
jgi:hypothetical protein